MLTADIPLVPKVCNPIERNRENDANVEVVIPSPQPRRLEEGLYSQICQKKIELEVITAFWIKCKSFYVLTSSKLFVWTEVLNI